MALNNMFAYDTNWKPDPVYGGWLAAEREHEMGLARLMEQVQAAQGLQENQYKNQIAEASVPAKQSEFVLQKLMNDQAINTPGYAQTMTQGSMDEALLKGQTLTEKTTANQEKTKDIGEADALQNLDNAILTIEANPDSPAAIAMAGDAITKLGLPPDAMQEVLKVGADLGLTPGQTLKGLREQYVQNKARTPKYMEKSLLQEQKDMAAMKRAEKKLANELEREKIKAAVKNAAIAAQQGKMNFQQGLVANINQIYSDPYERITAIQIAQQYQGEVQRFVASGLNVGEGDDGRMKLTTPTAPTPPVLPKATRPGMTPQQAASPTASPMPVEDRSTPPPASPVKQYTHDELLGPWLKAGKPQPKPGERLEYDGKTIVLKKSQ